MDSMTPEEKAQFAEMQTDIKTIKSQSLTNCEKIDLVYYALKGNQLSLDGGLVHKINNLEDQLRRDNVRLKKLEGNAIKVQVYIGIAAAVCGGVLTALIKYFIDSHK